MEFSTLWRQVDDNAAVVLENLGQVEASLRDVQQELSTIPTFVRGFVVSEVKRGSGQDLATWLTSVGALVAAVRDGRDTAARNTSGEIPAADRDTLMHTAERATAEQPKLQRLADFMAQAPSKVGSVPPAILPAERRAEFLDTVERQSAALASALSSLPVLADALRALASR